MTDHGESRKTENNQMAEEQNVYEICQLFDKDCDETIHKEDLIDFVKALGVMMTQQNIAKIEQFRNNQKSKIPFKDLFDLYYALQEGKKSKAEEEEELLSALAFFERGNDSNFADIELFRSALTSFGNKLKMEQVDEVLSHVSFDRDNTKFNYKELIKYLLYDN